MGVHVTVLQTHKPVDVIFVYFLVNKCQQRALQGEVLPIPACLLLQNYFLILFVE